MSKKYPLIVFDWDGTLMDSEARIVTCMQRAAATADVPVPAAEAVREIIGLGLREAMERLFGGIADSTHDQLIEGYREAWFHNDVAEAPLFAGARTLLQRLHRDGYLLAVATGKSRRGLNRSLDESGLGEFFHATRCADETFSKPHPQMLEEILVDLDTVPGDALVVGDSEYDMQMARNAGVAAVGMAHGVHAPERLIAEGAMTCFADLDALAAWLYDAAPSTKVRS